MLFGGSPGSSLPHRSRLVSCKHRLHRCVHDVYGLRLAVPDCTPSAACQMSYIQQLTSWSAARACGDALLGLGFATLRASGSRSRHFDCSWQSLFSSSGHQKAHLYGAAYAHVKVHFWIALCH